VPDPYLEIGGGARSSRPRDKVGGGPVSKCFFRPFGTQFGLKLRGAVPRVPPLDPPLGRKDGVEIVGDVRLKSFEKARAFLTERLPRIEQNNPLIFFFIIMVGIKLLIKSFQT